MTNSIQGPALVYNAFAIVRKSKRRQAMFDISAKDQKPNTALDFLWQIVHLPAKKHTLL